MECTLSYIFSLDSEAGIVLIACDTVRYSFISGFFQTNRVQVNTDQLIQLVFMLGIWCLRQANT